MIARASTGRRGAAARTPDLAALPSLRDLRRALPARCLERSTLRSLGFLARDLALIASTYALAVTLDSWLVWPVAWFALGTLFWSLFVIGHDCGHGSFSPSRRLNAWIGHLVHTPILVPHHGWRISHGLHHRFAGDADRDEGWYPHTESELAEFSRFGRWLRLELPVLVFPLYLMFSSPGRWRGSQFNPYSGLYSAAERRGAWTSALCCAGMLALLATLAWREGGVWLLQHYGGPYLVFVVWLGLVTYLHHTDPDVSYYRGAGWSFVRGALSTVDRHYGPFEAIHHHIGFHVAHHLFPRVPHYHLVEATAAIEPLLGEHYRRSDLPLWRAYRRTQRGCRVADGEGAVVRYRGIAEAAPTRDPLPTGRGVVEATR